MPTSNPPAEPTPSSRKGDVRAPKNKVTDKRSHKERVRASAAWALEEYASTLEKLSK